jgi:serine/threonine protein kinase
LFTEIDVKEVYMPTKDYRGPSASTQGLTEAPAEIISAYREDPYVGALIKDRYLIEKELGRGGIGVVYLARDRRLHSKSVVVKVLLEEPAQDAWFKKKFRQEIEALARIDHPGVVGALDAGATPDGKPFLVMQFIKGQTLRSLMSNEGMEFDIVAQVIRQTSRALNAAHDEGIIHCDMKPENLMLQDLNEDEPQVKILDFGVAKVRNSQVGSGSVSTKVAGTIHYMAPEQIAGKPSALSDIFALGVIAYEMLTGRRPFNPRSELQILDELRVGIRIKPKDLRPDLPEDAQEAVLKALSFNPADRYSRARDFGEALARALTAGSSFAQEPAPKPAPEPSVDSTRPTLVMAHVLFMDLVGYSKAPMDEQARLLERLQEIVRGANEFRRAQATNRLLSLPTGDGMALVFFGNPVAPVQCALEVSSALQSRPDLKLRMGAHTGPVYRVADINASRNVAGGGINIAQRVMDCGDAGHILISKSVADVLGQLSNWVSYLHDLGEREVKHGVRVHLFNLYKDDIGNAELPEKLRTKTDSDGDLKSEDRTPDKNESNRMGRRLAVFMAVVVLAAIGVRAWQIWRDNRINDQNRPGPSAEAFTKAERSFSYSVKMQKYRNGVPFQQPRQLAGADVIFERDYRIKLSVNSSQPGYFYVLNEPPGRINEIPRYIILLAAPASGEAPAALNTEFPEDTWLQFDDKEGTEKLWLVWSASQIPALEVVRGLDNPRDEGRITDPGQAGAVKDFLKKFLEQKPVVERDEEKKQTSIKGRGDTLVYPLELKHM